MSNKRTKFVQLAEKRVTRTVRDIRLVGNLSNRARYEYSAEDAQKIIRVLESELKQTKSRFEGGGDGAIEFKL